MFGKLVEEYSKDDSVISLIHHPTHLANEVLNECTFRRHKEYLVVKKITLMKSSAIVN